MIKEVPVEIIKEVIKTVENNDPTIKAKLTETQNALKTYKIISAIFIVISLILAGFTIYFFKHQQDNSQIQTHIHTEIQTETNNINTSTEIKTETNNIDTNTAQTQAHTEIQTETINAQLTDDHETINHITLN